MGDNRLSEVINKQDSFAFLIGVSSDSCYLCMWSFVVQIHGPQLGLDATYCNWLHVWAVHFPGNPDCSSQTESNGWFAPLS